MGNLTKQYEKSLTSSDSKVTIMKVKSKTRENSHRKMQQSIKLITNTIQKKMTLREPSRDCTWLSGVYAYQRYTSHR